jgi:transposase InsO family protein
MFRGLKRDQCLSIAGLTKNQYYHLPSGLHPGSAPSKVTKWRDPETLQYYDVDNRDVIDKITALKLDPDHANWYRLITITLKIMGFYINHKKVYRLMFEYQLLEDRRQGSGRSFVLYKRACPLRPLHIIEMDIKYVWIRGTRKYAYILTILDTFTRYALHWKVGYCMKKEQVEEAWEYVVANYFQPAGIKESDLEVEVRNDNGKQFTAEIIQAFFKNNKIRQLFIHPYTPEENGHVESFHQILGKALANDHFNALTCLEKRLNRFYHTYCINRSHSGILGIPPAKFWALYQMDKIEVIPLDKRRLKFRLKIAYQDIMTLSNIDQYEYRV